MFLKKSLSLARAILRHSYSITRSGINQPDLFLFVVIPFLRRAPRPERAQGFILRIEKRHAMSSSRRTATCPAAAAETASPSIHAKNACFASKQGTERERRSVPQAVEKPTESSRGPKPSRISIVPSGVYGGRGTIFAAENLIFQSKNRFLADFAPGDFEEILAKSGEAENPKGFQVSPKAKLPTAKSKILTRHRGGGRKAENPLGFQVLPLAKLPRLKSKI